MTLLRRLLEDCRGSALAVELAILFPVVMILAFGTFEVAVMLMVDATLEMAVRTASRYATASGNTTNTNPSRDTTIANIIHAGMDRWAEDPSNITISMITYPSFDNIGKPEPFVDANNNGQWDQGEQYTDVNKNGRWDPDMAASGSGGSGDVVLYTVSMTRHGFTNIQRLVGIKTITWSRYMAVQNE